MSWGEHAQTGKAAVSWCRLQGHLVNTLLSFTSLWRLISATEKQNQSKFRVLSQNFDLLTLRKGLEIFNYYVEILRP